MLLLKTIEYKSIGFYKKIGIYNNQFTFFNTSFR